MPRFTIHNLLFATFWLVLWGTAFVLFQYDVPDLFRFVLALFIVAGPFMVAGSSVGKTLSGAKCSAVAIGVFLLWYWLNDYPLLIGNS
jgi:hypothetical protein